MKTYMYVIFDSKAEFYNKPFFMVNDQVAMRTAHTMRADPNIDIFNHPEDFTMFKIGEYDDLTAYVKTYEKFEVICRFHELQHEMPLQEMQA